METAALIMAGGRSERMRAGGSAEHKSLRTVRGVPLLEWNLRALEARGFTRVFVAVSAREERLRSWLSARPDVQVLVEEQPLGTIGAASLLPPDVQSAVVVNVDNLTSLDLRELLKTHLQANAAATIATHVHPFRVPFGMLELTGDRVTAYREKPQLPIVLSSGTYVLGRRAIDRVQRGVRTDVPALIETLLRDGEHVAAHRHSALWIDVNDEAALAQAHELFA
jgi:NDP-sugar pyrophosphorylase family protein